MNTQHHGLWLLSMEALLHNLCPNATGSTELCNLFEYIVVCIPEEGQTASKIIYVQASLDSSLNICNTISDGECDFLGSGRTSLTDVITGNRDSVPLWNILGAIFKYVGDQTHGWTWREDVGTTCSILLQDIILNGTLQLISWNALLLSNCNVHGQQYGSWSIDSH